MAWIEKRGKKYRVCWDVGTPDDRKRRTESFDTPEEADQHKKKIEYQMSIGIYIDVSKMTFGEYLDYWLKHHGPKLGPKTLESYEGEIKNHIKPGLGKIKLAKLAPLHLQEFYSHLQLEGKANVRRRQIEVLQKEYDAAVKNKLPAKEQKRIHGNLTRAKARLEKMIEEGRGGLSNTTINYHHRIIHKALEQAMKWQMVAQNVADAVEAPKPDDVEIDYVKRHELEQFIACIKSSVYYAIYMVAIFTGMRQGEILGLKWQYVDFDAGIIKVRQQLQYTAKKGYSYPKPKQKSIRDIPMPLPLNAILRQVRKEQERLREIYDDKYEDNNLVFCTPEGRPLNRSLITRSLSDTLEKHGFKHIRFHALRHTFATMARAAGVPMEDIQDLLGHADISTTKNMYTHVEIEPLRKSVDKLTEYMGI